MKEVDAVWVQQPRKKSKFEESTDVRSGEREFATNKVNQQTMQAINKRVQNFVAWTLAFGIGRQQLAELVLAIYFVDFATM